MLVQSPHLHSFPIQLWYDMVEFLKDLLVFCRSWWFGWYFSVRGGRRRQRVLQKYRRQLTLVLHVKEACRLHLKALKTRIVLGIPISKRFEYSWNVCFGDEGRTWGYSAKNPDRFLIFGGGRSSKKNRARHIPREAHNHIVSLNYRFLSSFIQKPMHERDLLD